MSNGELARLQDLARIDELVERLGEWTEHTVPWQPARQAQALVTRPTKNCDRVVRHAATILATSRHE